MDKKTEVSSDKPTFRMERIDGDEDKKDDKNEDGEQ